MSMSNVAVLDDYERQVLNQDYLGRIVWYSVRDLAIPHRVFGDRVKSVGLDAYMPKAPADSDVFRRVCSGLQRRLDPSPDGTYVNVLIRNVTNGKDEVVRRIVCERVDAAGKRLDYTETWDLVYSKEWGTCTKTPIDMSNDEANEIAGTAVRMFQQMRNTLDSNSIRSFVKKVLDDNEAIMVRPTGGVMFVPEKRSGTVEALETVADSFGSDVVVHGLPLVNTDRQRSMVKDAVAQDTSTAMESLRNEMRDLMSRETAPSPAKVASVAATFRKLQARTESYTEVVSDRLETTNTELALLRQMMSRLTATAA